MPDFKEVITIDGPTGAGKTTLGHWLADELNYEYLESGYLYRAAAHQAVTTGAPEGGWGADLIATLSVQPRRPGVDLPQELQLDGHVLSIQDDLFSRDVDSLVARVAASNGLRQAVRSRLRDLASDRRLILSGRDAGTRIAPEAPHKFFLTATKEVRSARLEGRDPGATPATRDQARVEPDERAGPRQELESRLLTRHLQPAPDALVIDTSDTSIEEVRAIALRHLGENE